MSDAPERVALGAAQDALVCALRKNAAPAGFDPDQIRRASHALREKRQRAVARAWPALVGALGDRFALLFARHASAVAVPLGGPAADGYLFARSLLTNEPLRAETLAEILSFELHYRLAPDGSLIPRRAAVRLVRSGETTVVGFRAGGFTRLWVFRRRR